jgi:hypothetical protein
LLERRQLRWGDINWEQKRFVVHSPKTEHHEDGESRVVPLFPELLPFLEEAYWRARPGTEFVITRYRGSESNMRTELKRIICKAGLSVWPKLFQNLRSTRQTELEETWPSHVVCAWLGNSERVAREHYLQVTDEHYTKAATALHNPVQYSANLNEPERTGGDSDQGMSCTVTSSPSSSKKNGRHRTRTPGDFPEGNAKSQEERPISAPDSHLAPSRNPPQPASTDLTRIVATWSSLPEPIRNVILALINAAGY